MRSKKERELSDYFEFFILVSIFPFQLSLNLIELLMICTLFIREITKKARENGYVLPCFPVVTTL